MKDRKIVEDYLSLENTDWFYVTNKFISKAT